MRFAAPAVTTADNPTRFAAPGGGLSFPPTPEQERVIDAFRHGGQLVVEALAGTGKTTTLRMLAAVDTRRSGLYLAYNKAIANEAQGRFPMAVQTGTAHSFAFRAVGQNYAHRLNSKRVPARDIARLLKVRPAHTGERMLSPVVITRLAQATVGRFCKTADVEIFDHHLPPSAETLGSLRDVGQIVLPIARRLWGDLCLPDGKAYFTHDHYLKLWQLTRPRLYADYILFDEAQDADPVIASIVAAQTEFGSQVVYVGDRNQQLYAWRGAVDAMAKVHGLRLPLTKSFRFGPAIAEAANQWLELLDSPHRVVGHDPIDSRVGAFGGAPDAVLCRTNGTALGAILAFQGAGIKVALAPGDRTAGKDILSFAWAARDLMAGKGTDHPELAAFQTWGELLQYVDEEEDGADLKRLVNIINRIGPGTVIDTIKALVPKEKAQVTVSTGHKAKGLEWNRVRVADDFAPPSEEDIEKGKEITDADYMLAYVTVTRAKHQLDPGPLSPIGWAR